MKLALAIETPEVPRRIPVALLSGTLKDKLSKASAWGADGVELMTVDPGVLNPEEIRSELAQNHLYPCAVASGGIGSITGRTLLHSDTIIAKEARDKLRDLVLFAAKIGAPLVTIGSFRGRLSNVSGDGKALLKTILASGADYAADNHVRMVLEPLNRYETDILQNAEETLDFIREVDHPALGMLLDTYHMNIEEKSWEGTFQMAMQAGRLWHIHIGDNNRLPPGCGMIPFRKIVESLRGLQYEGFLSAELFAKPDPDTAGRQTLEVMREFIGTK